MFCFSINVKSINLKIVKKIVKTKIKFEINIINIILIIKLIYVKNIMHKFIIWKRKLKNVNKIKKIQVKFKKIKNDKIIIKTIWKKEKKMKILKI